MTNAINILIKDGKSKPFDGHPTKTRTRIDQIHEYAKENRRSQMHYLEFVFFVVIALFIGFSGGLYFSESIVDVQIEPICLTNITFTDEATIKVTSTNLYDEQSYTPEQLHLSLGKNSTQIYVTWSTMKPIQTALQYCRSFDGLTCNTKVTEPGHMEEVEITEKDTSTRIKTEKLANRVLYTYRAKMVDLETSSVADNIYLYKVVARDSNMREYSSKTYQYIARNLDDPNRELRIAFYGDLGIINGKSIPRLIRDVDDDQYDAIIHNGDFAYDLDTNLGQYGDQFMRMIEPIAARVPYQTSVGNHEAADNFTHYDHRFTMINSGGPTKTNINNFYYSFNMGPIHFIAISTEFYYFAERYGLDQVRDQYHWLEKDLKFASSPTQRALRPWIVVFGHRPMYCSSRDGDDCSKDTNILRKGLPFSGSYALESLFYEHGVDVELYSHEHQYERFLPIYDGTVMNGTDDRDDPYYNAKAPVHLISGSAGCQENLDPFVLKPVNGSVRQISDYGYTRISATRCAIRFEQVSDDKSGTVVDEFILSKSNQNFPIKTQQQYDCSMFVPFAS